MQVSSFVTKTHLSLSQKGDFTNHPYLIQQKTHIFKNISPFYVCPLLQLYNSVCTFRIILRCLCEQPPFPVIGVLFRTKDHFSVKARSFPSPLVCNC